MVECFPSLGEALDYIVSTIKSIKNQINQLVGQSEAHKVLSLIVLVLFDLIYIFILLIYFYRHKTLRFSFIITYSLTKIS